MFMSVYIMFFNFLKNIKKINSFCYFIKIGETLGIDD